MRRAAGALALVLAACGGEPSQSSADVDAGADVDLDTADALPDESDGDVEPDASADAHDDALDADPADAPDAPPEGLPTELPFEFVRPEAGTPPTAEQTRDFTRAVTAMWRDTDYWRWVRMTSHGVDASNPDGLFHYALWWQDTEAVKEGDTVTFRHTGRADNLTLRTCKVLNNAIAGYLMTGDDDMRWVVEEYSRGIAALSLVTRFGEDDDAPWIQARAPFTVNGDYETVGGRHVRVDYDPVRRFEDAWNARIVHNPTNPTWGDVWFVNQRSKDDVPHMFRSVPMLERAVAEAPDESVREAAQLALDALHGFAADIVASGYQIRTKFEDGIPVIPLLENGTVKDLASLVLYEEFIPNAECNAKLGAALIGTGTTGENSCGHGSGGAYEEVASTSHYFNYAIIRYFHIAAVYNALMDRQNDVAQELLLGLAERADRMMHDPAMPHRDDPVWEADTAAFLLAAAAAGLPLTGEEAQLVQAQYTASAEHYREFPLWDLWDASVADGTYAYVPNRGESAVRETEVTYLLEYCYSPFRNPAGAPVADCDVVRSRDRWGE
ncbi:MAG: hypothetical protein H6698_09720 [Myxococcales bacterium]|nr:hypothetical protein [Myxococcales bacterium]MCB9530907.1 hypothetical protein [Myxococcales bacterium]MCB9534560.1 hypothetical protein [Myxococcales bacterium]